MLSKAILRLLLQLFAFSSILQFVFSFKGFSFRMFFPFFFCAYFSFLEIFSFFSQASISLHHFFQTSLYTSSIQIFQNRLQNLVVILSDPMIFLILSASSLHSIPLNHFFLLFFFFFFFFFFFCSFCFFFFFFLKSNFFFFLLSSSSRFHASSSIFSS